MAKLTVAELPTTSVRPNALQPRKDFDGIEELASSIELNGLLQPITVRPVDDYFEIVAGERRFRAMVLLEWETVPCIVRELEQATAFILSVMENVARRDMNPIEEAHAFRQLLDSGMTPLEVEQNVGYGAGQVVWKVTLLNCIDSVQHLVKRGQISQEKAAQLGRLSPDGQLKVLHELQERKLTQSEFTTLVEVVFKTENQIDMFPETKLDKATLKAAQDFRQTLEQLVRDATKLAGVDVDALGEAYAHELPKMEGMIDGAIQILTKARRGIRRESGRKQGKALVS